MEHIVFTVNPVTSLSHTVYLSLSGTVVGLLDSVIDCVICMTIFIFAQHKLSTRQLATAQNRPQTKCFT